MTRYLLDTHILIWWWVGTPELPLHLRQLIASDRKNVFVSPISALEIGIKVRLGKLELMREIAERFVSVVEEEQFCVADLEIEHGIRAGLMVGAHRDPFDRLLAAQAIVEDFTIVSRDAAMRDFGCKVLW